MIEPRLTNDSHGHGPTSSRRPILLARIPHVSESIAKADDHSPTSSTAPPTLRDLVPPPTLSVADSTTHTHVDPPHASQTSVAMELEVSDTASSKTWHQAEPSKQYFRQDTSHKFGQPQANLSSVQSESSGGLFQLQQQVTSNSGLIVTLALAASAILLLLAIVSPNEPSVDSQSHGFDLYGSVPMQVPEFAHPTDGLNESSSTQEELSLDSLANDSDDEITPELIAEDPNAFSWDAAFRATHEPGVERLSAKPPSPTENPTEVLDFPEDEPPEEEEPEFTDSSASDYPTTSHPELDFSLLGVSVDESNQDSSKPNVAHLLVPGEVNSISR